MDYPTLYYVIMHRAEGAPVTCNPEESFSMAREQAESLLVHGMSWSRPGEQFVAATIMDARGATVWHQKAAT